MGVSKIHGVGVIALCPIRKGERIYANALPEVIRIPYGSINKLFPWVRKVILDRWPNVINESVIGIHDVRLLSLMNHSPSPNYDPYTDTAKCDIMGGEELTENYMLMPNWEKVWPLDKNQWLTATNVEKPKSLTSLIVARLAKLLTKTSAPN